MGAGAFISVTVLLANEARHSVHNMNEEDTGFLSLQSAVPLNDKRERLTGDVRTQFSPTEGKRERESTPFKAWAKSAYSLLFVVGHS